MKVKFSTLVAPFAFGLTACKDKKAVFSILLFCILCCLALFISSRQFVNPTVAPKWFGMVICVGLSGVLLSIPYHNIYVPVKSLFLLILIVGATVFFKDWSVSGFNYYLLVYTVCLFLLFLILQQMTAILPVGTLFGTVVVLTAVLAVHGLLQYAGRVSPMSGFRMTGRFDNPAGFAAALACTLPYTFYFLRNTSRAVGYISILLPLQYFWRPYYPDQEWPYLQALLWLSVMSAVNIPG